MQSAGLSAWTLCTTGGKRGEPERMEGGVSAAPDSGLRRKQ